MPGNGTPTNIIPCFDKWWLIGQSTPKYAISAAQVHSLNIVNCLISIFFINTVICINATFLLNSSALFQKRDAGTRHTNQRAAAWWWCAPVPASRLFSLIINIQYFVTDPWQTEQFTLLCFSTPVNKTSNSSLVKFGWRFFSITDQSINELTDAGTSD